MTKIYKKEINNCIECPNFNEEIKYENTFSDCPKIENMEFFCGSKKIRDAQKDEKGIWNNSSCKIPDWCPLENKMESKN